MSSCSTSKQKPTKVVSKYFNDCKAVMDESLTEFQEPKKNVRGPKLTNTTKPTAKPRKRVQKKIKGQKDIKTAFQKNDIVEFTEDFNRICAQSGVDVDAEQLQLAIALSKSLNNTETEKNAESDSSVATTSQQRSGKVRSTLLEYGFKVPEVKIDYKSSRRLKKYKKNSLLLLKSEEEKLQNIADKYSQIIFDSLATKPEKYEDIRDINEFSPIYNKATNTKYEKIKNNKYFYIENLIEVSTEAIGSLLKDWSTIPGRPKSPILKPNKNIQVSKITLSDTEIDILLSGKLIDAQKMVYEKSEFVVSETIAVNNEQIDDCDPKIVAENPNTEEESLASDFMNQCDNHELKHQTSKKPVNKVRSPSPDLFDEDLSLEVADDVKEAEYLNRLNILSKTIDHPSANNEVMDLTDSINEKSSSESLSMRNIIDIEDIVDSDDTINKPIEVSNCIANEQDNDGNHEEQIDLTQTSDHENDATIVKDCKNNDNLIVMDTSSESEDEETLPYVEISGQKPLDCLNGSLNIRNYSFVSKSQEPSLIILDEDDNGTKVARNETVITEKGSKSSRASNFEEYSYNHSDDGNNKQTIDLTNIEAYKNTSLHVSHSQEIDLTQSSHSREADNNTNNNLSEINRSPEKSLAHSYSCPAENDNLEFLKETNVLALSAGISAIYDNVIPELEYQYDNNNDGADVSITETLITPVKANNTSNLSQNRLDSSQKTVNTDAESEIFEISDEELNYSVHNSKYNLSQDNISEPEYESPNFDLGGISVINNLLSAQNSVNISKAITNNSYELKTNVNESRNYSFLPAIEIAGAKLKSPKKIEFPNVVFNLEGGSSRDMVNNTPKSNGFIVKTIEVTPLVDYGSLSTPERNRELDRYGLKPFKRKRAIQLLTHLYNQTHPIVEVTNEPDISASPAKRRKPEIISPRSPKEPTTSRKSPLLQSSTSTGVNSCNKLEPTISQRTPKKPTTPKKLPIPQSSTNTGVNNSDEPFSSILSRSPIKPITPKKSPLLPGSISSGDVQYEVTNFPPLNEVECCPEDWVFQKKEKAKLQSCRVPLHIALYNYISSCQSLRETILRYEPVNIDVIHKDLVAFGHRYDPKDLLKFLDKKCITVKTADNSTRNQKQTRQKL